MQRKELQDLKLRHKDELLSLEKEKNQILLDNKELEYKVKQQRITMESERLEIVSQVQRLEGEKISLEQALKSCEGEIAHLKSLKNLQNDSKTAEIQREFEILKEEHKNELVKSRQASDKVILELRGLYEAEFDVLKQQISTLHGKLKGSLQEIEYLKENNNANMYKLQVEELENELEYYKSITNTGYLSRNDEDQQFRSICTETLQSFDEKKYEKPSNFEVQKEILQIQIEKYEIESKELKKELEKIKEETVSNEHKLKNEIKFLIGKLLKAKSKLSTEGELSESIRRESMISTLRYGSMHKSKSIFNVFPKKSE